MIHIMVQNLLHTVDVLFEVAEVFYFFVLGLITCGGIIGFGCYTD